MLTVHEHVERIHLALLERVVAPEAGGAEVRTSELGFTAASRGGAVVALQSVFADPTRVAVAAPA